MFIYVDAFRLCRDSYLLHQVYQVFEVEHTSLSQHVHYQLTQGLRLSLVQFRVVWGQVIAGMVLVQRVSHFCIFKIFKIAVKAKEKAKDKN